MTQREGFSISMASRIAGISRAGFYRKWAKHEPREADTDLRDAIQRIVLGNRCYGYRRVTAALRQQGRVENRKRVLRLMRSDNLLALRKRRFVGTTNSRHGYLVYSNLAGKMEVTRINQLWVADITYIRLREEFVYLAVVLDAYSRRVIGWALGESLEAKLPLEALDQALAQRSITAGIMHHSDRGFQYCSEEYIRRLEEHGFQISMSRPARPYDNARMESFMKTLKNEEVNLQQYRDLEHVRSSMATFIDEVYNGRRLHSALNYRSPADFEAALASEPKPTTNSPVSL
jgi:transposase InsO family protein